MKKITINTRLGQLGVLLQPIGVIIYGLYFWENQLFKDPNLTQSNIIHWPSRFCGFFLSTT